MKKFRENYGKTSKCGLVSVLHLRKQNEIAKYQYIFRKRNKNRTTCKS